MSIDPKTAALGAVTAAVLPLVYWVTWRVLTGPFAPELQASVAAAIVSGALGSILGTWFGATLPAAKPDHKDAP